MFLPILPDDPFTNWQIFVQDQIENICRGQIKHVKMTICLFDRAENIVGKEENAGYHLTLYLTIKFWLCLC